MQIVHPEIEQYLLRHAPIPHPVIEEMEKLAEERTFPIVGPLVGRFLVALIQFGHIHTVLECGSGFGYSAVWMALALAENSKLTCVEYDEDNIVLAKKFLDRAGVLHKVNFIQGDATKVVPGLTKYYDLIVNDVDKEQYPKILPHFIARLRIGGMLVSDNVLWHGKVVESAVDEKTRAIQQFNSMLIAEDSLWNSFIPLRDGLSMSVKLNV